MGLSIQFYPRTQEGVAMIESQKVFCLGGDLYQGYLGGIMTVFEKQLSDAELEAIFDVDQTIDKVLAERKARLGSRVMRKDQELSERRAQARAKERDELELLKLKKDLGLENAPTLHPDEESGAEKVVAADPEPTDSLAETPSTAPDSIQLKYQCPECNKTPPLSHKDPSRWLNAHKMGAHHQK